LSELVIIVTGSRTWTNVDAVRQALRSVLPVGHRAIVYHGACPTGADRIVADLPPHPRVTVVPMPADWKTYGDSAGPRRERRLCGQGGSGGDTGSDGEAVILFRRDELSCVPITSRRI
jgi:hypothetical protein